MILYCVAVCHCDLKMAVHTHDSKHTYVFTPLQHHTTYYNVVIVVFVYIITFL